MGRDHALNHSALIAWLAVQLAALTISAWQVPLARTFPQPAERLALHVMLASQVAAGAMLFPALSGWKTAVSLMATCWPFMALAGALSSADAAQWTTAASYASAWLVGLTFWRQLAVADRWGMVGSAMAQALSLGGVLLWYAHHEFGSTVTAKVSAYGPLLAGMAVIDSQEFALGRWLWVLALLATGAATKAVATVLARRAGVGQCGNTETP